MVPHGNYAAPWQGGRLPLSPRTGRAVAQSTAQRDYDESRHSVPVVDEAMAGGFWDFEEERKMGPRRAPQRPPRHDEDLMRQFFERSGNRLTVGQWELYKLFWERMLSYGAIAKLWGTNRDQVYERIRRLRVSAADWQRRAPQ